MSRIAVQPSVLRWARERSGVGEERLSQKFPKYPEWENGTVQPTLRQLEDLAKSTFTPLGVFFLPSPPEDRLPIADFRTINDRRVARPSPHLLETVQTMRRRQDWLREYLIEGGAEPLACVRSIDTDIPQEQAVDSLRQVLRLQPGWAEQLRTWEDALRELRDAAEEAGIMVATNSVVGNSNHRKLDPEEFRGFVLVDEYAPLVFVNGADSKSAQMFTLAHELMHVLLGREGVVNLDALGPLTHEVERFCNRAAAEFLVPKRELAGCWLRCSQEDNPYEAVARHFKVSPIVAARRLLDLGYIAPPAFWEFYSGYLSNEQRQEALRRQKSTGGPSFHLTQRVRLGSLFSQAVVRATAEGRLLYRDAYNLTGLHGETFDHFAQSIESGVTA